MRILLAADTYAPNVNGAANFAKRLAQGLAQAGHTVGVIAPSTTLTNEIDNENQVTRYGVGSIPIPIYSGFRIAPFALSRGAIRQAIRDFKPDIIHVQSHFIVGKEVILAAKKFKIPVVGTNHFMPDNLIHYFPGATLMEKELKAFGWWQFRQAYEQVDLITTPTKTAADILHSIGIRQRIEAISCGIDGQRFSPGPASLQLQEKYQIPKDVPAILYVGRLDQEKQIDVLIQAIPLILAKQPVHLILAGTGHERLSLESLVHSLGLAENVTFTGFVADEDLPQLYRSATIFVMPSPAELQSIATLEAIATGLPVVLANALALPELVIEGENGYLFATGNSQQLADGVNKILADPTKRQHMGQRSLELSHKHDIHQIIARFVSLYKEVLAEAHAIR